MLRKAGGESFSAGLCMIKYSANGTHQMFSATHVQIVTKELPTECPEHSNRPDKFDIEMNDQADLPVSAKTKSDSHDKVLVFQRAALSCRKEAREYDDGR